MCTSTTDLHKYSDSALLGDYVAQVQLDQDAGLLDPSPAADRFYHEIMRRMSAGKKGS